MNINTIRKILLCFLLSLSFTLISCGNDEETSNNNQDVSDVPTEDDGNDNQQTSSPTYTPQYCALCNGERFHAETIQYPTLSAYSPTTFVKSSVKKSTTDICKGVSQHTYTFTMNSGSNANSGKTIKVVVTEVDLNYAGIAAGTKDNNTTTTVLTKIYNMATAFEKANPDKTVVAAVNGDFYGSLPVNAFVKDGVIMKNSHNDNGGYDYTNTDNDIPASMPMLFGVSGTTAQINPIIKNGTVEETIKSKLYLELSVTHNGVSKTLASEYESNIENGHKSKVNICYKTTKEFTALAGSTVLKVKLHSVNGRYRHGEVAEIINAEKRTQFQPTDEYYYIMIPSSVNAPEIALGDIVSHQIASADGTWNYYDQIIGCRQALVIDGQIASTVKKENTNGAQSTNVPRTAVGILPNGHVALFSVEALRYGGTSSSSSDTYGLNLPQLADFMRYFGVYSGANFDGGGSTQLITRLTPSSDFTVLVRSSDTGSSKLTESRSVINSVLVYIKNEE